MGKYSSIVAELPTLPPEDLSTQAKIDELKNELRPKYVQQPEALVQAYEAARYGTSTVASLGTEFPRTLIELLGKEGLKELLSEAQKKVTAFEQLMVESLDQDEPGWGTYGASPTMLRLPNGGSVNIQYEPVGRVEEPEVFRQWVIDNGLERELTLPWQRRESLVKERALEGESTPGIRLFTRPKVVFKRK